MKRVDQTHFAVPTEWGGDGGDGPVGNCLQAAVATVMGTTLDETPHFVQDPPGYDPDNDPHEPEQGALWWRRLRKWLRDEHAVDAYLFEIDTPIETIDGGEYQGVTLLTGKSPRGEWNHVVVAAYPSDDIIHDPHPSRDGLDGELLDRIVLGVAPYEPEPITLNEDRTALVHPNGEERP